MRKRKYLIGALATAVAVVGVSSIASGARTSTQLTTADICPVLNQTAKTCTKTLKTKRKQYKNATLHTVLAGKDSADPEACRVTPDSTPPNERGCHVPPSTNGGTVFVDFDNDIKFNVNSVGKCSIATIFGDDVNTARSQCGPAWIGSGSGFGRFGTVGTVGSGDVPVNISAFNSVTTNQIMFHVDPGFAPFILVGTLGNSPQPGDYGKRLSTPVSTANTLIRFDINIARGKYIQARCKDKNKKLDFHYRFNYGDTGIAPENYPSSTDTTYKDSCKRIPPRRRR